MPTDAAAAAAPEIGATRTRMGGKPSQSHHQAAASFLGLGHSSYCCSYPYMYLYPYPYPYP